MGEEKDGFGSIQGPPLVVENWGNGISDIGDMDDNVLRNNCFYP